MSNERIETQSSNAMGNGKGAPAGKPALQDEARGGRKTVRAEEAYAPNRRREPAIVPPAVDVDALQQGVISRNAPRQMSPFGKVIAWTLSVLLVLTCWNSYSLEQARRMIIGDDAVPMASGAPEGDEILDDLENDNTSQAANKNEEGDGTDDGGADGNGAASENDADAAADDIVSEADMQAYLPQNLLEADKVLPRLSDDAQQRKADGVQNAASRSNEELAAAMAARAPFALNESGAWRASDGVYQVAAGSLALAPSLGNQALALEGGYLGGAEDTDAVAFTFTAPYLYKNAEGAWVRTNGAEDWKAHGGEAAGARAILSFPGLPAGWAVYTEHMGKYLKHTAEEAAAGLSGTIVVRFDGVQDENGITVNETRGQMPAGTALPGAIAQLSEGVPAAEKVDVTVTATVNSYTAARNEDGTPILAEDNKTRKIEDVRYVAAEPPSATVTLSNAEPQVALGAKVEPWGEPLVQDGTGWAAFLVTVEAAKGALAERGYTLRVADEAADAAGAGMLNADGIVAFDATGMTAQDLAAVNPADDATVDAALAAIAKRDAENAPDKDPATFARERAQVTKVSDGVADLAVPVRENDALTFDAMEGKAENNRVIYVAVPYAEEALSVPTIEVPADEAAAEAAEAEGKEAPATQVPDPDAMTYNPEAIALTLTASFNAKTVQEEKVAGAATVNDTLAEEDVTYI